MKRKALTRQRFAVHRVYCMGRNYAAHAREMGMDPEREPPFFFSKPADAVVPNGASVTYPPRTTNLHHEIELVVAIGTGGRDIPLANALAHVFGYAVGNDLTRRDLQFAAREKGQPWDVSKGFDHSAPVSAIRRAAEQKRKEIQRSFFGQKGRNDRNRRIGLYLLFMLHYENGYTPVACIRS